VGLWVGDLVGTGVGCGVGIGVGNGDGLEVGSTFSSQFTQRKIAVGNHEWSLAHRSESVKQSIVAPKQPSNLQPFVAQSAAQLELEVQYHGCGVNPSARIKSYGAPDTVME